jgi:predicted  nucleic acid-binding Zn-ribbon protein
VRFKAGIILIIFAALICISGCMNQGSDKEKPIASEISTAQESEKTLPEKDVAADTDGKEAGADNDTSDDNRNDSITSHDGVQAAVPQKAEASLTQPVSQNKISISGSGVKASREINLTELKQMDDILITAYYFSCGTEKPGWGKTVHNEFSGVLLYELLADHVGLNDAASQVKIIAEDEYTQIFSIEDIKAEYIDETDESKKLRMISAWQQDGQEYNAETGAPFRLVMGQQFEGDYNRQKWVNNIARIIVE